MEIAVCRRGEQASMHSRCANNRRCTSIFALLTWPLLKHNFINTLGGAICAGAAL